MLQDRVAIITGASRGIGKCIALRLAQEGMHIVAAGKTVNPHPKLPGTLLDTQREIKALGGKCLVKQVDVREEFQVEEMVKETLDQFHRIDVMINNAGALWWQPVLDTPPKRFDLMWKVNVRGTYLCSRYALSAMQKQKWGHIISMSPPIRLDLLPGKTCYFITKYGMSMFTLGLAEEVKHDNIAVNALWPATLIESLATINFNIGTKDQWRKPTILAECVVRILKKEPASFTGKLLIDEDFLREEGITDFSEYAVIPGSHPGRIF